MPVVVHFDPLLFLVLVLVLVLLIALIPIRVRCHCRFHQPQELSQVVHTSPVIRSLVMAVRPNGLAYRGTLST